MKCKLRLLLKQTGKCAHCDSDLKENNFDIDHIERWCDTFDDSDENKQLLCVSCHRKKTKFENELDQKR